MHFEPDLKEIQKEWHGSLNGYIIGFFGSLVLTIASFSLVGMELLSGKTLTYALVFLALFQAVWQLIFFLHLGQEAKPRWETFTFCFMFLILLIIVFGSLWIMNDLELRGMSSMEKHHD